MEYKVIGYTLSNNILFEYKEEMIVIKNTLPKSDLCLRLDIDANSVDKYLRNSILNLAKKGGQWDLIYKGKDGKIYEHAFLIPENQKPYAEYWKKI